jgi:cytochrome c biogenesis protein CcdA
VSGCVSSQQQEQQELQAPWVTDPNTFPAHLAALFERTGGRVPSKETKTYLGAGLAVLGVNLVSMQLGTPASWQLQAIPTDVLHWLVLLLTQVIASFVITAFREQPAPISKKEN